MGMWPFVPPGGAAGAAQQAPAVRQGLSKIRGGGGGKKRRKGRKKKAASAGSSRKRRKSKAKRPAKLVKGSAAAKRYMASIRAKRKK